MNHEDIAKIKMMEANDVVTKGNVTLFWGGWASQWYPSEFTLDGELFNCAEQFMMWCKAKFFGDHASANKIMREKWPKAQKELGRAAGPYNPAWDEPHGSRFVVARGTLAKFEQNDDLRKLLLSTGDSVLGEASPYDDVWGIGFDTQDPRAWTPSQWTGKNWLGQALMAVRTQLRATIRCGKLVDEGARQCHASATLFYQSETTKEIAARCASHPVIPFKPELGRLLELTAVEYEHAQKALKPNA